MRNNNALGLWYIRKGRFCRAEQYLLTAVKTLQKRNPNPYDGEPIYNLGLALKYQGRYNEAYDRFINLVGMQLGRMPEFCLCTDFYYAKSFGRCIG